MSGTRISFSLREEMREQLKDAAETVGVSVSVLIRKCIEHSLDEVVACMTMKEE